MAPHRIRAPHPACSRLPVPGRVEPDALDTGGGVTGRRPPGSFERAPRTALEQALWALRREQELLRRLLDGRP